MDSGTTDFFGCNSLLVLNISYGRELCSQTFDVTLKPGLGVTQTPRLLAAPIMADLGGLPCPLRDWWIYSGLATENSLFSIGLLFPVDRDSMSLKVMYSGILRYDVM